MSCTNRRVLLVDDHAEFLDSLRQLLAERFEVHTARSGAEALARCERHGPFAAVVSDYGMPGMTGIQLLAELRQLFPDTQRLLLTGCSDLALALEALEEGAIFRFLTKPPQPARLVQSVTAAVARHTELSEERLATEQLAFTCEALRELQRTLDARLAREGERLAALAHGCHELASATSLEDVLARGTAAVEALLGSGAARLVLRERELEIVPERGGRHGSAALGILAGAARQALERSERSGRVRETRRALLEALQGLARHRDDETGAHLARVSNYCRFLALALRVDGHHRDALGDEAIDDLVHSAPLHDVGKVAIPDAILFKPGKLDEREWNVMRTHAAVGAEILRSLAEREGPGDLLAMAREIAWTHHERWDGGGYPRGLAGAEIPLWGRIMAVADCYDALTSERPYKHAWTHAEAVAHLAEQRGRAFDPVLIDSLLARQDELRALLEASRAEEARLSP